MNLYGDWANADVLARGLIARGLGAAVEKKSVGDDVCFDAYDFIYIGSGTERSQRACMRDMMRLRDELVGCIEAGMQVLATGNAHELFGVAVTDARGERFDALGLLPFETVQRDSRVTGDSVFKASFLHERLIGFINRAGGGQEGDIERPFIAEFGPAKDGSGAEGIRYKNLLGTYMTGPILVRNPPLLKYIIDILVSAATNADLRDAEDSVPYVAGGDAFFRYQEEAYKLALKELLARREER